MLRGNPHQVAAVADTLQFEHKYTSGVIAWTPEDNPSDAQIGRVVDEFEKTAWAGLEPDRYTWAAVQHREAGGGVHVHVLAARCDLAKHLRASVFWVYNAVNRPRGKPVEAGKDKITATTFAHLAPYKRPVAEAPMETKLPCLRCVCMAYSPMRLRQALKGGMTPPEKPTAVNSLRPE